MSKYKRQNVATFQSLTSNLLLSKYQITNNYTFLKSLRFTLQKYPKLNGPKIKNIVLGRNTIP